MNLKQIFLGAALTSASFGLIACGGDSGSNADDPVPTSSQTVPGSSSIYVPPKTISDSCITKAPFSALMAGSKYQINGGFSINDNDTTVNLQNVQFTSLDLNVVDANGGIVNYNVAKGTLAPEFFPMQSVVFNGKVFVDFADPAFTTCGDFTLQISVTAKEMVDGRTFATNTSVALNRPQTFCIVEESSSSAAEIIVEMDTTTIVLATDGANSYNVTTGIASANDPTADIIVTSDNGIVNLTSGTQATFAPITNSTDNIVISDLQDKYQDDWTSGFFPEEILTRPTRTTDFRYNQASLSPSIPSFNEESDIFVAQTPAYNAATGDGFFAFTLVKKTSGMNNQYELTIHIWKKK